MNKLVFSRKKDLRLENVLRYKWDRENGEFDAQIERMQSYIKMKGTTQVGPLVQYTKPVISENGELDMEIMFLLQCKNYINNVENPYIMESLLRVTDCMYCRYIGPEESMKIAYDKISVEAFEVDQKLLGSSYTIFLSNENDNSNIIADVFMERAD